VQTIRQECHKNVGFDPLLELMKKGTQRQIAFEVLKGSFDLSQLRVELPEFFKWMIAQVSSEQISKS
jgi:hypothetical protein